METYKVINILYYNKTNRREEKDLLIAESTDVLKRLTPQNQKLIINMVRVADIAECNVRGTAQAAEHPDI